VTWFGSSGPRGPGLLIIYIIINISAKGGPLVKTSYFGALLASLTMALVNAAVFGVLWVVRGKRKSA